MRDNREILGDLEAYRSELYADIDLTGLAVYVLELLNERKTITTFENITVSLFRQFPEKFCLEGYPKYPDSARVGRTLLQLGPKYRNWATGKVQKGFVLTDGGKAKLEEVRRILSGELKGNIKKHTSVMPRGLDLSKELSAVEESNLFTVWDKEGVINATATLDLLSMLGTYDYTSAKVMRDRLKRLRTVAVQLDKLDVIQFLDDTKAAFPGKFKD